MLLRRCSVGLLTKRLPRRHQPFPTVIFAAQRPHTMATDASTFKHPDSQVPIHLPPSTSLTPTLSRDELLKFPAFKRWHATLTHSLSLQQADPSHPFHKDPYKLQSIAVTGVDRFGANGERLGFVKIRADVRNAAGETLPGIALLRGPSVGLLVVLTVHGEGQGIFNKGKADEEYTLLTVQPRVPAGSLALVELPAGMLDDAGSFAGAAAKELEEECGIEAREDELVDMTALLAAQTDESSEKSLSESLQRGVLTSPGGQDECVPLMLLRRKVTRQQMDDFEGRLTGERGSQEKITLRVVPLGDVWRVAWRDAKALAAVTLYRGLGRQGKL